MNGGVPVGRREDQHHEFKARESLEDPRAIAREVVGFLNADGGSIWIGVPEVDGVAQTPTPIPEIESARETLQDRLLDLVLPPFVHDEVAIVEVPLASGGAILRVDVRRPARERRPFAFAHKGMLGFTRRAGHRLIPLPYQEVRDTFRSTSSTGGEQKRPHAWLIEQRDACVGAVTSRRTFIGLTLEDSNSDTSSEPSDTQRAWWDERIRSHGRPSATSLRWSLLGSGLQPRRLPEHLEARSVAQFVADHVRVRAYLTGSLLAEVGTDSLTWSDDRAERAEEREQLHPYYVLGVIASFFELASAWLARLDLRSGNALIELGIGGATGLALRAHSPQSHAWLFKHEGTLHVAQDDPLVLPRPVRVSVEELVSHPGRVAVRVAERLYEAFDFELNDLPREVDRQAGAITLPD